ncbi:MAG: TetR/AcrR family transcriptional regulator [Rhizobiales bacterium]|nr:TetR/AcrR family transcriptional regulator [Hyphomicrobiales bacterium]
MTALPLEVESSAEHSAKRRQIMDGARRVFVEHGFDGASVNDIVKATGVSKGTVYAYFPSKEKLFETLIFEDRRGQAERLFEVLDDSRPVEEVLREIGLRFGKMLIAPEQIAYFRMIIAASAKFPQAGRAFYEAGPRYGLARVTAFIKEKVRQGELQADDPEMAARQLLELIHCGASKPLLFGVTDTIPPEEIERAVNAGVATFMAAYGRRASSSA